MTAGEACHNNIFSDAGCYIFSVMPDVMAGIDLQERAEGYVEGDEDEGEGMEASGEDVKDMADLVFDKHTGNDLIIIRVVNHVIFVPFA